MAHHLDEVLPALQRIDKLVNEDGLHAAGFLSFESAPAFDKAHQINSTQVKFPLLWFGIYPRARKFSFPKPDTIKPEVSWLPTTDRETYNEAIDRIKEHIRTGQTYQVNYTMRLRTNFKTDPWKFFIHLAQIQNNYAAYIDIGRYVIASVSPELFFKLDGESITARPMKGTIKRGRFTIEDKEKSNWLYNSEKNRAENVMIVDMIRNDLGRIAKIGSVHVPELFTLEKYPTLWQMTSTIKAKTDASITEIFTALFPCASITGAPKINTMRIISELETTPRIIYTGSIGYFVPNRKASFNVAIRTVLIDRNKETAEYGVGGGIVWDSTSNDEYTEALLKARTLTEDNREFSLFETMLWTPKEGFFLLEKHIERLLESADYFDFSNSSNLSKMSLETYLKDISSHFKSPQRVRLILEKNGKLSTKSEPYQILDDYPKIAVCLAKKPVNTENVFLFHKTSRRSVYDLARKDFPEYDDVLLYNEQDELTEFTIGNIVVEMDGKYLTPPVSCGLLAGTFRGHLLKVGQIQERVIRVEELKHTNEVFLVNSVRKWQRVNLNVK